MKKQIKQPEQKMSFLNTLIDSVEHQRSRQSPTVVRQRADYVPPSKETSYRSGSQSASGRGWKDGD
jgi:hypothetical protein